MKRIGVIGIVVSDPHGISVAVQEILSDFSDIIVGRMGVPIKENCIAAMSVIVKGENERISALAGKLGRLEKVNLKSALTSMEIEE